MSDVCTIHDGTAVDPRRCLAMIHNVTYRGAACVNTQCQMFKSKGSLFCEYHIAQERLLAGGPLQIAVYDPSNATPDQGFDRSRIAFNESIVRMAMYLSEQRDTVEATLKDLRDSSANPKVVEDVQRSNAELEARIMGLMTDVNDKSAQITQLQNAIDADKTASDSAVARAEGEKAIATAQYNQSNQQLSELLDLYNRQVEDIQALNEDSLQKDLEYQGQLRTMVEIDTYNRVVGDLAKQRQVLLNDNARLLKNLTNKAGADAEVKAAVQKVNDLKQSYDQIQAMHELALANMEELQARNKFLEKSEGDRAGLLEALAKARTAQSDLRQELATAKAMLVSKTEEATVSKVERQRLQTRHDAMVSTLEQTRKTNSQSRDLLNQCESASKILRDQVAEINKELTDLQSVGAVNAEKERELESLRKQLAELSQTQSEAIKAREQATADLAKQTQVAQAAQAQQQATQQAAQQNAQATAKVVAQTKKENPPVAPPTVQTGTAVAPTGQVPLPTRQLPPPRRPAAAAAPAQVQLADGRVIPTPGYNVNKPPPVQLPNQQLPARGPGAGFLPPPPPPQQQQPTQQDEAAAAGVVAGAIAQDEEKGMTLAEFQSRLQPGFDAIFRIGEENRRISIIGFNQEGKARCKYHMGDGSIYPIDVENIYPLFKKGWKVEMVKNKKGDIQKATINASMRHKANAAPWVYTNPKECHSSEKCGETKGKSLSPEKIVRIISMV